MSNTVITNYTDINGPSTKADSSVVVIVNKDGSLSVDEKVLSTLMSNDRSQGAGISVVRIGHDGPPDDATDSDSENDDIPHVTLSVDSYYDEPNSIIKYDSGAEMLHSLRIETRENSLVGFQNDHCYTSLTSPSQSLPQRSDSYSGFDEPIIEIKAAQPSKPVPSSKKITILDQQILPKGRKIIVHPTEGALIKGKDVLSKPLLGLKAKNKEQTNKSLDHSSDDNGDSSSSISSSGESVVDRDSDSDYKDAKDKTSTPKFKRANKSKPRILKSNSKVAKARPDFKSKLKANKSLIKREIKEKILNKSTSILDNKDSLRSDFSSESSATNNDQRKVQKLNKKEKRTPSHVTALLSDMTSLFSTPDVIRRVSTDTKTPYKPEKEQSGIRKSIDEKVSNLDNNKNTEAKEKHKERNTPATKIHTRQKDNKNEKETKGFEPMPQIDDVSLAQILQDTTGISPVTLKTQPAISTLIKDNFSTTTNSMNSPGLAGPLSPTLDLLAGLQPEEEGLTEDLLMHVAQLVESSENLQEVIDKQVLGKVDAISTKSSVQPPFHPTSQPSSNLYSQISSTKTSKLPGPRKDPIEIVRRDGRVITLPPIEAPATRASKRKSQMSTNPEPPHEEVISPVMPTPEPRLVQASKQCLKKIPTKKSEPILSSETSPLQDVCKTPMENEDNLNSEDDPNRLWCICKQPHNNRFMICCDSCEDWFHGKCVNITKAMGQQMEEQGIEWTCPNCIKKTSPANRTPKTPSMKTHLIQRKLIPELLRQTMTPRRHSAESKHASSKTGCIVCKKSARASSIYCSDACILKHAQDSLGTQPTSNKLEGESGRSQVKSEADSSRVKDVIVFDRKTGRCLVGPSASTPENLKLWLQKNPTFEVVRTGTVNATKPKIPVKKSQSSNESHKIQTTLNFEKIPRKSLSQTPSSQQRPEPKVLKTPTKEETRPLPPVRASITPKALPETPKPSTSSSRTTNESKKATPILNRSQSTTEKRSSNVLPKKKEKETERKGKNNSTWPIRDNVRKSLQQQMTIRMKETTGQKFTEVEIKRFTTETETELHELFKDVGMKYKAKYRSLMFNIKDRKNLSLWQKICEKSITPKQLVRLSPEELASQELAEWRDNEAKHQLELIKKSELDLLAANKTYVLKTHKGEEVMEPKTAVSTELDPNVPVEDLVTALNDSTATEEPSMSESGTPDGNQSHRKMSIDSDISSSRKRNRDEFSSHSRKKNSKAASERGSRSTRKSSQMKEREERSTRRSEKKTKSGTQENSKSKNDSSSVPKRKPRSRELSRHRSRSRGKSKSKHKSKSKTRSRSRERSSRRGRSQSSNRSKQRSRSRESRNLRSKRRSRSKQRTSSTDKSKHRSRSQENDTGNNKTESREVDTIERPKSAMMREVHPEYDPHEPMITSAFSDEDLRKSREDVFNESYKNEDNVEEETYKEYSATDYTTEKAAILEATTTPSSSRSISKREKLSEGESDQEPSSTVDSSAVTVWNGCINMVDVARFYVAAHEVSGNGADLEEDLNTELDIVGRINPATVWDYINKMKRTGNKDIILLRLAAANDEEKMQYIALYSYLSSRNRLGVVRVPNTTTVKDFYILPLSAQSSLPTVLLPLDGPGLDEARTHLLIAIVIRQRKKRVGPAIQKDIIPAKVARESRTRSYTPPTSPRRPSALSTSVKDQIAASLACADEEEAYSPGSSTSSGSGAGAAHALRNKMEELNRQIEEQKQQIRKMVQVDTTASAENEAYSPSRPMTPPSVVPLADISLPSNLQEILATIKQRTEAGGTSGDVDMRSFPPSTQ